MKSDISRCLRTVLAATVLGTPLAACGAPTVGADRKTDRVEIGIGGVFKVGRWTTLTVTLGPRSPVRARLEVDAPDPDGSVVTYQGDPVLLKQTGPNVLSLQFRMGRLAGTINVRVVADEGVLFTRSLRAAPTRMPTWPPLYANRSF